MSRISGCRWGKVSGTITGGSSGLTYQTLTTPPAQVGNNDHNVLVLFAFDELQSVTLASNLTADSSVIPAGTVVDSHYVFFDPLNNSTAVGDVTFDGTILDVISTLALLNLSDSVLGLPSGTTSYNSPSLRGFETSDSYSFVSNIG